MISIYLLQTNEINVSYEMYKMFYYESFSSLSKYLNELQLQQRIQNKMKQHKKSKQLLDAFSFHRFEYTYS